MLQETNFEVTALKLSTGEEIICSARYIADKRSYAIKKPLALVMNQPTTQEEAEQMQKTGPSYSWRPVFLFYDDEKGPEITVPENAVVAKFTPEAKIRDNYVSVTTGLKPATAEEKSLLRL